MRIHNLYEDEHGVSHWGDVEVEWTEQTVGGPASRRIPASGVIFREMPMTYDLDWHVAPRRQYVVHLDGDALITASDGESRTIKAGEIVLVEDVAGTGHRSKNASAVHTTACSWRSTELRLRESDPQRPAECPGCRAAVA